MRDKVLIYSSEEDVHVDHMMHYLADIGATDNVIRLNSEHLPLKLDISLGIDGSKLKSKFRIMTNNLNFEISELKSIWYRKPDYIAPPRALTDAQKRFVRNETQGLLSTIWNLSDCYWFNNITKMRDARNKFEQLRRAANFGLQIPRSIVTNNREEAVQFYDACKNGIIYKTIDDPMLGNVYDESMSYLNDEPKFAFTTLIKDKDLLTDESIKLAPCYFQEYIEKKYELRITVVVNKVFSAALYSNDREDMAFDWRMPDRKIIYEATEIPNRIANILIRLVKSYGLNFAAIDMIVTPDNDYVFLELNPNGQFYFVQEYVPELKILEEVAAHLLSGE